MSRKTIYILVILVSLVYALHDYIPVKTSIETQTDTLEIDGNTLEATLNSASIVGDLTITNEQNDENNIEYTYTIEIPDIEGSFKYTYNDEEKYLVFTANGKSQITLKSNESITIHDIPYESSYTITQTNDVSQTYTTEVNNTKTTTTEGTTNLNTIVIFSNKTIKEEIVDKNPITEDKNFYIVLIICSISLIIYYLIKKIKIKRFE